MTDIKVEKRKKKPLWPWILALIAVITLIWILAEVDGDELHDEAGVAADTSSNSAIQETDYMIRYGVPL